MQPLLGIVLSMLYGPHVTMHSEMRMPASSECVYLVCILAQHASASASWAAAAGAATCDDD